MFRLLTSTNGTLEMVTFAAFTEREPDFFCDKLTFLQSLLAPKNILISFHYAYLCIYVLRAPRK